MHAVLRHYTLSPKDVDEVVRRITEGGVPIIKAIPGFVAYTMLDAGGGKLVTYSLYESPAGDQEGGLLGEGAHRPDAADPSPGAGG